MTRSRVIVERRSLTRLTPEQALISAEDHAEYVSGLAQARLDERCPVRVALVAAFQQYVRKHGAREARCWAAAQAHFDPGQMDGGPTRRDRAEQAWATKGRAA